MAKIVSPVWSHISGSIAGTTYLTTAAGQIIGRQRTVPVNTPSTFKTAIKNALQTRAAHWNALTTAQRTGWDVWAQANGYPDGRTPYMSGTVFIQFLSNIGIAGVITGLFDDRPDTNNIPQCNISPTPPVTPSPGAIAVKISNVGPQRVYAYVEISAGFNAARRSYKGPYNWNMAKAFSIASGVSPVTDFVGLVAGLRYFVRVRVCTADTVALLKGNRVAALMYTDSIAILVP